LIVIVVSGGGGAHLLWLEDEPNRAEELRADVRTKGLYIAPVSRDIPRKVSHGLIHDWLGVGFVPNAKIEDVLLVARDYDHYKDIYRPGVIESAKTSSSCVLRTNR
jgi:hypothetical protein